MHFNDVVIGRNTLVKGNLKAVTEILIKGQVEGSIYSDTNVILDSMGTIKGLIECADGRLEGALEGTIKAKKIYLTSTAKVMGDLNTNTLKIDEGAVFVGSSKKINLDKDSKLKNTDPIYEL